MAHRTRGARVKRAALITTVVVLGASAGCKIQTPGPDQPVVADKNPTCDTALGKPVKRTYTKDIPNFIPKDLGRSIIYAEAKSTCIETPRRHVVQLHIDMLVGATWAPIAGFPGALDTMGSGTIRVCEALPIPGQPAICQWAVPCQVGTFRTMAQVTGTSSKGVPFSRDVPVHPQHKVTSC